MKKHLIAASICSFIAFSAWWLWPAQNQPVRSTASQGDRLNISILNNIPLYKGLEKPKKNELKIAEKLTKIFEKIAKEGANSDGSLNRGTHAKGSCFEGETKVLEASELASVYGYDQEIIDQIKLGVFSGDDVYDTELRFANAKGDRNPDTDPDVRGVSFSLDTKGRAISADGSSRIDFMMNSSPMFAVNNITEFYELMKTARLAQGDFAYFINPFYIKSTLRAKKLLDEYERSDIKSYATESYWGNLPYVHGVFANGSPREIVKYKMRPCSGPERVSEASDGKASDYLQKDIQKRADSSGVCFQLQVQLFDHMKLKKSLNGKHKSWSRVDWIENGGELWEESVLPFYTVAQITIPKGSRNKDCDGQYFNTRLHSSKGHRPIGSIARVRTYVEESSRYNRQQGR